VFPLHDENPTRTTPVVTITLIAINVVVFLWQWLVVGLSASALLYGLIPAHLLNQPVEQAALRALAEEPQALLLLRQNLDPAWLTIFTSMFLHGSWLHILGNMWYLWVFGNNVEDEMGKGKFLAFYLICGVAAALSQVFLSQGSPIPMVGASGALAGVLGAYLLLHPHSRVTHLVILGFFITTITTPAWVSLGLWIAMQVLSGLVNLGPKAIGGGVAYAAHVGGFVAGLVLVRLFTSGRRRPPADRYAEVYEPTRGYDWR
jgi:membrane associated rhomboid family serine protease